VSSWAGEYDDPRRLQATRSALGAITAVGSIWSSVSWRTTSSSSVGRGLSKSCARTAMRRASRRESLWTVTTRGYRRGPTRSHIRSPTTHLVHHGLVLDLPRASGLRALPAQQPDPLPPRPRACQQPGRQHCAICVPHRPGKSGPQRTTTDNATATSTCPFPAVAADQLGRSGFASRWSARVVETLDPDNAQSVLAPIQGGLLAICRHQALEGDSGTCLCWWA